MSVHLEERPGGSQAACVLPRVGVPDHALLVALNGVHVVLVLVQRAHCVARIVEVVEGLKQRGLSISIFSGESGGQKRRPSIRPPSGNGAGEKGPGGGGGWTHHTHVEVREAKLAHEELDAQDVACGLGHADDVGAHGVCREGRQHPALSQRSKCR